MDGFEWVVLVDGADVAGLTVAGGRITHGRTNALAQPAPTEAFVQLVTVDAASRVGERWPEFGLGMTGRPSGYVATYAAAYAGPSSRLTIGAPVVVAARTASGYVAAYESAYAGAWLVRFTGLVTGIDYSRHLVSLSAVSSLERAARLFVTPAGWPAETDVGRAQRIATAAGLTLTVVGAAGCTVAATAAEAEEVDALAALQALAADADATVLSTRAGAVQYRTRLAPALAWSVPAATVDAGMLALSLDLGRLTNAVAVEYGPPDARASVSVEDAASIATHGRRASVQRTSLATADDAAARGNRTLDAFAEPAWRADTVRLLADVSTANTVYVMGALDVDDTLTVPVPLAGAPVDTFTGRVIGTTDDLSEQWALTVHLDGIPT